MTTPTPILTCGFSCADEVRTAILHAGITIQRPLSDIERRHLEHRKPAAALTPKQKKRRRVSRTALGPCPQCEEWDAATMAQSPETKLWTITCACGFKLTPTSEYRPLAIEKWNKRIKRRTDK